jgi:hypothetical protein
MLIAISAGDASFYKPYAGQAGGSLQVGDSAVLTLPERAAVNAPRRPGALAPRLRLRVSPSRAVLGRRTRFTFRATVARTVRVRGRARRRLVAVRSATVRFAGHRARTNRRGRAVIVARLRIAGRRRATVTKRGYRIGRTAVRARRARR